MNNLTICGCGMVGAYRTPWCSMLNAAEDKDVLHLYYPLKSLAEEVEKRTSYLGKFRRTEEAKHLLDLISMTQDEGDMFYSFARLVMADVFDALRRYIPAKTDKVYLWDEGGDMIELTTIPDYQYSDFETRIQLNGNKIVGYSTFKLEGVDSAKMRVRLLMMVSYGVEYTINESSEVKSELRKSVLEIECAHTGDNMWCGEIAFAPSLAVSDEETSSERVGWIESVSLEDIKVEWKAPEVFRKGQYVKTGEELYIALVDGDANDYAGKLQKTEDYRHSIHYLISYPKDKSVDLSKPLDATIFEALVTGVMYKWLEYSYPDEAERFFKAYESALIDIRARCIFFAGSPIVHRVARYF